MAISKTSLCNAALTLCGAQPITNITDDTENARTLNRVYELSRQSILVEEKWNFATTRATLSLSASTMPWSHDEEAYVYVRPTTALRIFQVSDQYATWREEGDYIISDTASLGIKYVFDHDDPSKYPPHFAEAFVYKLASDIAFAVLNSRGKSDDLFLQYDKKWLPKARSANSQTGTQQETIDDAWLNSKFHNGGGGNQARSYS